MLLYIHIYSSHQRHSDDGDNEDSGDDDSASRKSAFSAFWGPGTVLSTEHTLTHILPNNSMSKLVLKQKLYEIFGFNHRTCFWNNIQNMLLKFFISIEKYFNLNVISSPYSKIDQIKYSELKCWKTRHLRVYLCDFKRLLYETKG